MFRRLLQVKCNRLCLASNSIRSICSCSLKLMILDPQVTQIVTILCHRYSSASRKWCLGTLAIGHNFKRCWAPKCKRMHRKSLAKMETLARQKWSPLMSKRRRPGKWCDSISLLSLEAVSTRSRPPNRVDLESWRRSDPSKTLWWSQARSQSLTAASLPF